jgi:hypothetical protein
MALARHVPSAARNLKAAQTAAFFACVPSMIGRLEVEILYPARKTGISAGIKDSPARLLLEDCPAQGASNIWGS